MANSRFIHLWSSPRNISTALMYSFAQRSDTKVVDEPLYAHYLSVSDASEYHPGAEEILRSQKTNGTEVINDLTSLKESELYFIKHMTHHIKDLDISPFQKDAHIILTREPARMIASFIKVIDNPSLLDLGYLQQVELKQLLVNNKMKVMTLDAKSLLMNPTSKLQGICAFANIPFEDTMLNWKPGPLLEDGVWAKYWYKNVHQSSGFQPYINKSAIIPDRLSSILKKCNELYNQLVKD